MKKISIVLIISSFTSILMAQNPVVVEKGAPASNNTLNNAPALNSNSGVNPMGNPGTITNSTSTSAATNQTLEAHPNIEPGTFLTSSPGGTVTTTVTNNGNVTKKTATAANTTGGTTVVSTTDNGTVIKTVKTSPDPVTVAKTIPAAAGNNSGVPAKPELPLSDNVKLKSGYTPVLGNYVPTETISKINSKYGSNVYDIRTVRVSASNKIAYLVRLVENGKFREELYYDLP